MISAVGMENCTIISANMYFMLKFIAIFVDTSQLNYVKFIPVYPI